MQLRVTRIIFDVSREMRRINAMSKKSHLMCDVFNLHVLRARKPAWWRIIQPDVDCETWVLN